MTPERGFAAVLLVLFACFLVIALNDLRQLFESRHLGDAALLVYCAAVCVGWIGFLGRLCWPVLDHSRNFDFAER
jgi:hypothetical protein